MKEAAQLRDYVGHMKQSMSKVGFLGSFAIDRGLQVYSATGRLGPQFNISQERARKGVDLWETDPVFHPDDIHWIRELRKRPVGPSGVTVSEFRIIDKGGNLKWLQSRSHAICGQNGAPVVTRGVVFDITEWKREGSKVNAPPQAPLDNPIHSVIDGLMLALRGSRELSLHNMEEKVTNLLVEASRILSASIMMPQKMH